MEKKLIIAILLGLILITPVSAGLFDFWKPKQVTSYSVQPTIRTQMLSEIDFRIQLQALNTPQAIQTLDKLMDEYRTTSVKVRVYRLPWQACEYCSINFYVVKGIGIVENNPTNDREIVLTHQQVQKLYDIAKDGKVTWIEGIQTTAIFRFG